MEESLLFRNGNHKVGYKGIDVYIIALVSDVKTFFECVDRYVDSSKLSYPIDLITDKLYRRSIKFEELDSVAGLMHEIEEQFKKIKTKDIDWSKTSFIPEDTNLDLPTDNLGVFFRKCFRAFNGAEANVKFCKTKEGYNNPSFSIRLVCSNLPFCSIDSKITDEQFDALEEDDEPIWMRKRYVNREMDDHIKRIEKRNDDIIKRRKEKQEKEAKK